MNTQSIILLAFLLVLALYTALRHFGKRGGGNDCNGNCNGCCGC